jgi:hypothetical protein
MRGNKVLNMGGKTQFTENVIHYHPYFAISGLASIFSQLVYALPLKSCPAAQRLQECLGRDACRSSWLDLTGRAGENQPRGETGTLVSSIAASGI